MLRRNFLDGEWPVVMMRHIMKNILPFAPPSAAALDAIRNVLGPKGVIEGADRDPFLFEWRGRWPGATPLVAAPATVEEVAKVVSICADHNVAITPQGGNTGLVGGQTPFGAEILLTLKRLNKIRSVTPLDNTMTVDAGVTLAAAQEAAHGVGRLFPLSIGSEGTCQIGGVISTNAGGVNVLRYGNMRDLVLGIEAVLPNGEIWNGLKRLRKDNTGYDLKQLFIGGEGTLGIVTGAALKLFPLPREKTTVFVGLKSPDAAVAPEVEGRPIERVTPQVLDARNEKGGPGEAPAILAEHARDWFEGVGESPFMLEAHPVREEKRELVPAIVHVDGTARVQTVHADRTPAFHALLEAFHRRTGVPVLLNTSFNLRGEPIVESPTEAVDTFLRTDLDALVLENDILLKRTWGRWLRRFHERRTRRG